MLILVVLFATTSSLEESLEFELQQKNRMKTPNFGSDKELIWYYPAELAGMEAMHKMRALQTPLHDVTLGSGTRLSTHTCPT